MRILVIRSYRLGDLVQITPFLAALRRHHPGAAIHMLTEEHFTQVLADHPAIAQIHALPKTRILAKYGNSPEHLPQQISALGALIGRLRKNRFDWVINRQAAPLESVIAGLCGGKQISGPHYSLASDRIIQDPVTAAFAQTIRNDRRNGTTNVVDHSFHVAGIPIADDRLHLPVNARARRQVNRMLKEKLRRRDALLIGIQGGASQAARHGDPSQILGAAELLLRDPRIHLLTFGSRYERQVGDALAAGLSDRSRLIRLEGQTPWQLLKAYLAACDLLITPDTGPMHVAAAVGTRVVGLFWESAHPVETGPYGPGHIVLQPHVACAPCFSTQGCPHMACRAIIRAEHIVRAAHLALSADGLRPLFPSVPIEMRRCAPAMAVRFWTTGEEPWRGPHALKPLHCAADERPMWRTADDQEVASKIHARRPARMQ